jgi:hypothetical protein
MKNNNGKLTTKLPNGKLKINKAAVIAKLMKTARAKRKVLEMGVLPVSGREIQQEALELVRYNADSLLNHSEE